MDTMRKEINECFRACPVLIVLHTSQGIGGVPLAQLNPSVGAVREKVLVSVEREILFIEIGFQMKHVPHAYETAIVGSCKVAGVVREYAGEEMPAEQWAFGIQTLSPACFIDGSGRPYFSSACASKGSKNKSANKKPNNVDETKRIDFTRQAYQAGNIHI